MSRLPGGVSVVRGCWLLLRLHAIAATLAFAVVLVIAAPWLDSGVRAAVGFFAVLMVIFAVPDWLMPAHLRVTEHEQPHLHALVRDAVARLRVPAPDRVWLGHGATVAGQVRLGRRELVIGLPVAYALSRSELAALVEHELTVLDTERAWLSVPLYRRWDESMDDTVALDEGESPRRRDARVLEVLGPLGGAVEQRADAARTDPGAAARALIRQERVGVDYGLFRTIVVGEFASGGLRSHRIEDLHDGWCRRFAAGAGVSFGVIDPDEAAMLARRHPLLQAAAQALVGQELPDGLDPAAIEVVTLSRRQRRRLAAQEMPPRNRGGSWRTFQTAPQRVLRRAASQDARRVLDAVEEVLGRAPAGRAEAADVVRSRPVEVALAATPELEADDIDASKAKAVDWLDLLEDALFDRGWVRADPVVPGILRDRGGAHLDGRDLVRRATSDPFAYAELRRLLADPA